VPQYMLLIYQPSGYTPTPEEMAAELPRWNEYTEDLQKAGIMRAGDALHGAESATTVRVRDDETLFTDGPFAETHEQLGGYYLLDCKDLDEAIGWAAKIPSAKDGTIEVRPTWSGN